MCMWTTCLSTSHQKPGWISASSRKKKKELSNSICPLPCDSKYNCDPEDFLCFQTQQTSLRQNQSLFQVRAFVHLVFLSLEWGHKKLKVRATYCRTSESLSVKLFPREHKKKSNYITLLKTSGGRDQAKHNISDKSLAFLDCSFFSACPLQVSALKLKHSAVCC